MKFRNKKHVFVYFDHNSTFSLRIYCDQIMYKEGRYLNEFIFLLSGNEVGSCCSGMVDHFEYFESLFSTETTMIDIYDVIGGDLVEA